MASYLAAHSSVDGLQLAAVLELAFTNGFFLPVAVGGVAVRAGTCQWLLAGYALNRFVERYVRNGKRTSNITISARSPEASEHICQISSSIHAWKYGVGPTSPFEQMVPAAQTSFIPGHLLPIETIEDVSRWRQSFPGASLHILGCVTLTGEQEHLPWDRSFRHLRSHEAGVPFVELLMRPQSDDSKRWSVEAFSGTEYWMLGTQTGCSPEALENLSRFSAFLRGLLQCGSDAELRLEGRTYQSAREHLAYLFDIRP